MKPLFSRRLLLYLLGARVLRAQSGADLESVAGGLSIRAVTIGDFGYEGFGSGRRKVSDALFARQQQQPFQLGLTVGDNFYPRGVTSVNDRKWKNWWEPEFGRLNVPFFPTLGNHDYDGREQAQIDYSKQSQSWRMPGRYYTFAAGPVRFFALDTDEGTASGWIRRRNWSDTQAFWLDGQLKKYKDARWKIVYGHHPIYSDGDHGDTPRLQEKLLPILQAHKVDAYLCGHDHDLEYFIEQGIHFVVVGGGGKDLRKVSKKRALFAVSSHGFLDLTADRDKLTLRLIADSGQELFSREVKK